MELLILLYLIQKQFLLVLLLFFNLFFFFFLICIYIGKIEYKDELDAVLFMSIDVFFKPFLFSMLVYASSGGVGKLKRIYSDWHYDLTKISGIVSVMLFVVIISFRDYIFH